MRKIEMNNRKQAGFTLVEIAIVLVIIGLLLGGILKGQELINSARVRNLADQNSGVQAAYFGFKIEDLPVPCRYMPEASSTTTRDHRRAQPWIRRSANSIWPKTPFVSILCQTQGPLY